MMSWLEAKHRRSEEKAEMLQNAEIEKIIAYRENLYAQLSGLTYDKHNVSSESANHSFLYLSDDTGCSDYGTDTYQLSKENTLYGRIIKLDTISPSLIKKHKLYEHIANSPASPLFASAINYSSSLRDTLKINKNYEYKSCAVYPLKAVNIILKHKDTGRIAYRNDSIMPDELPATINLSFSIISEKDFQDVRVFFLLAPNIS